MWSTVLPDISGFQDRDPTWVLRVEQIQPNITGITGHSTVDGYHIGHLVQAKIIAKPKIVVRIWLQRDDPDAREQLCHYHRKPAHICSELHHHVTRL